MSNRDPERRRQRQQRQRQRDAATSIESLQKALQEPWSYRDDYYGGMARLDEYSSPNDAA